MSVKWEYKIVRYFLNKYGLYELKVGKKIFIGVSIIDYFNTLGEKGWEMISAVAEIGHYVPSEQAAAQIAGMLFSPIGPAYATHHTTSIGHSVWFKRQ